MHYEYTSLRKDKFAQNWLAAKMYTRENYSINNGSGGKFQTEDPRQVDAAQRCLHDLCQKMEYIITQLVMICIRKS